MPKAEWGTKRMCASCGVRFYDFAKTEVACPSCGAIYDLEQASRVRRTRMGSAKAVAEVEDDKVKSQTKKGAVDDEEEEDEVVSEDDDDTDDEEGEAEIDGDIVKPAPEKADKASDDSEDDDEDDESLIEDASELGDDDDVSDVIESDIDEQDENN